MTGQTQNSCGTCALCCTALGVKELDKPAGVTCQHCTGTGCGIYETRIHDARYEICKSFLCGWRLVPQLGDAWRPDRSGVLMVAIETKDVPEEHRAMGHGIEFMILGGEKAILRPGFAEYVMTLVTRNVAVYLSADSPKTLVNKYLRPPALAKDKAGLIQMLLHLYRQHVSYHDINQWKPLPWVEMP